MVTIDTLRLCGETLYGARWRRDLASTLGVSERTVLRWIAGDSPIPDIAGALDRALATRARKLDQIREQLEVDP
jgi:hypothetical protein